MWYVKRTWSEHARQGPRTAPGFLPPGGLVPPNIVNKGVVQGVVTFVFLETIFSLGRKPDRGVGKGHWKVAKRKEQEHVGGFYDDN
jgi:hypothetical protein